MPADRLALTVRYRESWLYWAIYYGGWASFAAVVFGGPVWCWRQGRATGRDRLSGFAWPLAIVATGAFAVLAPMVVVPSQHFNQYGYWRQAVGCCIGLLALFSWPVGSVLAYWSHGDKDLPGVVGGPKKGGTR